MRRIGNLAAVALLGLPLGLAIFTAMLHQDGRRVGLPLGVTLGPAPELYPDDRWTDYLAPETECPGAEARTRPVFDQAWTMICLLNWAREERGLRPLAAQTELMEAALLKARDLEGCAEFKHDACGWRPDARVREVGYRGKDWGENLYFGTLELASPRVALDRWLRSQKHRANVFGEQWTEVGVALIRSPAPTPEKDSSLWVAHFGHP